MKKKVCILLSLLLIPLISCSGGKKSSTISSSSGNTSSSSLDETKFSVTYYLDYNHVDSANPYKYEVYDINSKINKPADPEVVDPAFPFFVGWSTRTQIASESQLWDFETVITTSTALTLYGIWDIEDKPTPGPVENALTVYSFISERWSGTTLYAYTWLDENTSNAPWPGEKMTLVKDSTWLYQYTVDLDLYTSIIFNTNSSQTTDIDLSEASKDTPFYNVYTKAWEVVPENKPEAPEIVEVTYTINGLPDWITNDDCLIFVWAWGGEAGAGKWYSTTFIDSTSLTFVAPNDITGCLLVRCVKGTTEPSWDVTGDEPGRIYNQSDDIDTISETMTSPAWKGYAPSN